MNVATAPDTEAEELGLAWSVPLFVKKWAKELPDKSFRALHQLNRDYFSTAEPQRVWAPRLEFLNKFAGDV
jgi:hypothetical protein